MHDDQHPDDIAEQKLRREWTAWRCDWERALVAFPGLSASDLAVGIEIARHARAETKQAWPSQQTIAQNLARSVTSVEKAVLRLVRLGFLSVGRKPANNGHAFNVYTLLENRIDAFLDQRQALKDARADNDAIMREQLVRNWNRACRTALKELRTNPYNHSGGTKDQPVQSDGCHPYDHGDKHLIEHASLVGFEEEGFRVDADFDDPWAA